MALTPEERAELLRRARAAAAEALGFAKGETLGEPVGLLAEPGASFVTWRRESRLRGCIGTLEPMRPLARDVESNSVMALLKDPRFPPATARDFPLLHVEVSVLAPRERISAPEEVEIGVHGLYVERGIRRGLLLPQVAPEWGWDAPKFLRQACLKAGLPEEAWLGAATVYRFTADVFGELAGYN